MRTIRLKIDKHVCKVLKQTANEYKIYDEGFLEDVFALLRLKGSGIPTDDRLKKMITHLARKEKVAEISVSILMKKRVQVLKELSKFAYFKALSVSYDPLVAVDRLLSTFVKLNTKIRQSECMACALLKGCKWGIKYGRAAVDATKIQDANWKSLVDPKCPSMPEIDGFNSFFAALNNVKNMMQADPSQQAMLNAGGDANTGEVTNASEQLQTDTFDPDLDEEMDDSTSDTLIDNGVPDFIAQYSGAGTAGKSNRFDATFTGEAMCKVFEKFVDGLTNRQIVLFNLGAKFSLLLGKGKSKSFAPVEQVDHDQKQDTIKSIADITKLAPSQHALPEEVFDAKLNKKELVKKQNLSKNSKKQLLYLLIDMSGSMATGINGSEHGLLTRASLASTFGMALAKKVIADEGWVYLRFFAGRTSPLTVAKTKIDLEAICKKLALANYNGGGTDITHAVKTACADIALAKDELARAELLMITDAEDGCSEQGVKRELGKTELNILDVAGNSIHTQGFNTLKKVATKYYKANETELNLNKMVELL